MVNDYIVSTPGVCGGKPRLRDTRITVQDIVIWTEQGDTPDDIVLNYPHLALASVQAALLYDHEHQDAIDRQRREDARFVAELEAGQRRARRASRNVHPVSS